MPSHLGHHQTEYLEYPSNIGDAKGVNHWISFNAYEFKAKNKTMNIALYIPGDALNTSYKSEYETLGLGLMGGKAEEAISAFNQTGAEGEETEGGAAGITKFIKSLAAAGQSEGHAVGMLKMGNAANKAVTGMKQIMEKKVGAVLNPYLVAAYKGPTDMRTHDFTFQIAPIRFWFLCNSDERCFRFSHHKYARHTRVF